MVGECLLDKSDLEGLGEQRKNESFLYFVVFNEHERDGTLVNSQNYQLLRGMGRGSGG